MWTAGGRWISPATFAGMVMAVMAQASNMVATKLAMSGGMDKFILLLYTNSLSTFLLLPSLLLLRRRSCPPLTSSFLLRFFLLSIIGYTAQIFGYIGINYSSPVLGTALMNLIPALTFILAVIFRMEKLVWKSLSSQAKVVGTIVSIGGAFIVTFYKGPQLFTIFKLTPKLYHLSPNSSWVLGGFFIGGEALMVSLWYIVQAKIIRDLPVVLVFMFLKNLFWTIWAGLFTIIAVPMDPKSWTLKADLSLAAVIYSTVVGTLLRFTLIAWCIKMRGPVYAAMFKPLGVIFAVVLGFFFLGDPLCRGSLIGAMVIVGGFYVVMWGKAKEEEDFAVNGSNNGVESLPQTSHKTPLLAQEQIS